MLILKASDMFLPHLWVALVGVGKNPVGGVVRVKLDQVSVGRDVPAINRVV